MLIIFIYTVTSDNTVVPERGNVYSSRRNVYCINISSTRIDFKIWYTNNNMVIHLIHI